MHKKFRIGEATLFKEPVEWPDPVVIRHDGTDYPWGMGLKSHVFSEQHVADMRKKYTRGLCHAHALACTDVHGGRLVALMFEDKVVHVLSLHEKDDFLFTRDVNGDQGWPQDWVFTPNDFREMSELHLLDCPVDDVVIHYPDPWTLPCIAPSPQEIDEAVSMLSVTSPIGDLCKEPEDEDLAYC